MSIQHKSFRFRVKAIDDSQGLIEAYGSVFNNIDEGDDVVRPGAFKRTIQNSKARVQSGKATYLAAMLWQHDPNQPIGGWTDLTEDAHGLLCKGQIVLSTQLGREAYELIKAGVVDQFSIGYDVPKGGQNFDKSTGARNLTELRLWEVSPVTFAMNQEALLVGVKSRRQKDFNDRYQTAKASDSLTDWYCYLLDPLSQAMMDAFTQGDSPVQDMSQALDQFREAAMQWAQEAVESGLSDYLTEQQSDNYYMMSRENTMDFKDYATLARKSGRAISQANAEKIQGHVDNMHDMANKAMSMMQEHTKAMHSAADDLATVLQGSEPTYGAEGGTPDDGHQEGRGKSGLPSRHQYARKQQTTEPEETEEQIADALAQLRALTTV